MKHVLIIAYYFPPMGLSGIQRTLKFVKYLPEYGWQPTVLTIIPHAYFAFDDAFLDELQGKPVEIWRTRPGGIFSLVKKRRTISQRNEQLRKGLNRISQFFFVPDNKIGWRKQVQEFLAAKDLSQYDMIFATAPPFTDHLIGMDIKERYGIPLVLDFRDAWVEYPYHKYWTPWHRRRHENLERSVVKAADAVITTNTYVRDLVLGRQENPEIAQRMHVITQGFDLADFADDNDAGGETVEPLNSAMINFVFAGIFYEDRDPLVLYRALATVRASHPELYARMKFYMVGYVPEQYQQAARALGVDDRIVYCGYVEHRLAVKWLKRADVVWFNIGSQHKGYETVSPGKAFEYLGSGKPIVAILPENQIREILSGFDHTFIIEPDDHEHLATVLMNLTELHERGALPKGDPKEIALYDRRRLTGELAGIFENILASKGEKQV